MRKNDCWITWVALTPAIMAVFAAITTLYVGKYSSRTIMHQALGIRKRQEAKGKKVIPLESLNPFLREV